MQHSTDSASSTPWNERKTRLEDELRYQNLIDIHGLTQAWLTELSPSADSHKLNLHKIERTLRPELTQSLWLLEKLKLDQLSPDLSTLVDSTTAEELLNELEETIWIVQTTTLENALETSKDKVGLMNLLEKVTWHYSKKIAEKRWPHFQSQDPLECFQAFRDSPLATAQGFLLEGHHGHECSFYWVSSPLSRESVSRSPTILELCRIYHEFMRGYFYSLCRSVRLYFVPSTLGALKTYKVTIEKA